MVETDPEFADKIRTITEKIGESNSTNLLLENQLAGLHRDTETKELDMNNLTTEFQELEAKLKELNEDQQTL